MLDGEITVVLRREQVTFELVPHERSESALAEAAAVGVPLRQIAKTVVCDTPLGHVRVVVPASARVDLDKLRDAMGGWRVHLATEEDLARDYPEFEVGAVPPFGGKRGEPVLVDYRLLQESEVVVEAGTHTESIKLGADDLVRVSHARVVDIAAC